MASAPNLVVEKRDWYLNVNAGPITRFSVCIDSPAMPDGLERGNTVFNNFPAALTVNRHHKANAA